MSVKVQEGVKGYYPELYNISSCIVCGRTEDKQANAILGKILRLDMKSNEVNATSQDLI